MSRTKATIWLGVIIGVLVGVGAMLAGCDERETSQVTVPAPPAGVQPREGTGIAIVVDISGSMGENVKEGQKEALARQCVLNVLQRCQDFAAKNPTKVIEVGVIKFDDVAETVVAFGKPNVEPAKPAIAGMAPRNGTAIGDAILFAKQRLDETGLKGKHIIVVTDGENNDGATPPAVAEAFKKLPADQKPAVYMIAFDESSDIFKPLKDAGWMVLSASNGTELQQTLDQVLGENILLERP